MKVKVKPLLMEILRERGLTQNELSRLSGVPQGSISRHEDAHLFAIARALDVRIEI